MTANSLSVPTDRSFAYTSAAHQASTGQTLPRGCGGLDYAEFFSRATDGLQPFAYQHDMAEGLTLPLVLTVPTGAGKTAATVLGWLYRRKYHPQPAIRESAPRRLVYCLPTRVLVEQTVQAARIWLDRIGLLASDPVEEGQIAVGQLMGGEVDNDWDLYPEREAVLVGTQDQLLSRALNRGYAMSRSRWPMHFGLGL